MSDEVESLAGCEYPGERGFHVPQFVRKFVAGRPAAPRTVAITEQVDGDDTVARGQGLYEFAPLAAGTHGTVQQHDGPALALDARPDPIGRIDRHGSFLRCVWGKSCS